MKVIIDTCALIAGAMGQSYEKQILELVRKDKIEMIFSEDVLTEYLLAPTNFLIKANKSNKMTDAQIKNSAYRLSKVMSYFICNCAIKVDVQTKGKYLTDESDDKIINLAIDGNAKYIVSLDAHLFEEIDVKNKKGENIIVVSAYQFIGLYNLNNKRW